MFFTTVSLPAFSFCLEDKEAVCPNLRWELYLPTAPSLDGALLFLLIPYVYTSIVRFSLSLLGSQTFGLRSPWSQIRAGNLIG